MSNDHLITHDYVKIYELPQNIKTRNKAAGNLFDYIDNLMTESKFEIIDSLFRISPYFLTTDGIVVLLTASLPVKNQLTQRAIFLIEAQKICKDCKEDKDLLKGL